MLDSAPPDESCEVLDGEVNDEERDKNDNKNIADSDDTHIVVKWGRLQNVIEIKILKSTI